MSNIEGFAKDRPSFSEQGDSPPPIIRCYDGLRLRRSRKKRRFLAELA